MDRLDLRVDARPEAIPRIRREVMSFVAGRHAPDPHAIGLAVTEAATNVILHGYRDGPPGAVRVVVCAEAARFVVVVRDWGTDLRPRTDSPGLGLGLPVIASLATEFGIEAADGQGTLLRMHFERVATAPLASAASR
ncbi:MAG: ATP-binding protein [Actinomycetota bacterium]|nr:ATP-binding protein [Actinomycetota bacterium]